MSSGRTRDFVLLYVNGQEHRVHGELALMQLADYLRCEVGLCGTKIVCAEGDCGACTVLIGRRDADDRFEYKPINACIQGMYQLDGAHVITVEGLTVGEQLNPIQKSMVDCHGAQCGYCTPGFIMSLAALFEDCAKESSEGSSTGKGCHLSRQAVKGALTGNLCRCTGYEAIIKSALDCDATSMQSLADLYPEAEMVQVLAGVSDTDVRIETGTATVFIPHEISSAVQFKRENEGTVIVSGGTDVSVNINKRGLRPSRILSMCNLQGLSEIGVKNNQLIVGAKVTLEHLAEYIREKIPEFYKILWVFGAPQIRFAGTLAGNIANASPIGDTLPFLFVMEAEVEVQGMHGTRKIPICSLYKGYKTLDVTSDEIITRILIPLPAANETLRLFKVSKREHLDISSFAAAFLLSTESVGAFNAGNVGNSVNSGGNNQTARIKFARVAFGGVGPVTCRLPETEAFLRGKLTTFDTFEQVGEVAQREITPISDVRGSSDFRRQLAENVFLKLWHSLDPAEPAEPVCAV